MKLAGGVRMLACSHSIHAGERVSIKEWGMIGEVILALSLFCVIVALYPHRKSFGAAGAEPVKIHTV